MILSRAAPAALLAAPIAAGGMPGCPILAITGLPCPTCGGTRAVHLLLDGDPDFVRYNPLWAAALLLACCWVALTIWRPATGRPSAGPRIRGILAWLRARPTAIVFAALALAAAGWATAMVNLETIRTV